MNVTMEKLDKVKAELTITVPAEEFGEAMKKAYKAMLPKIKIPGFRPGKAPMAVVEKNYGPEVFYEDAANDLIFPNYIAAVKDLQEKDASFQPISRPEFDIDQIEKGKDFIFKAVVDTKQEIALGEYKGLEIQEIDGEVTDHEIDQYIDSSRDKHAEIAEVTDPTQELKNGDLSNINFVGKKDGVAFQGGTGNNYDLAIGSGQFIPGFEVQMIGMKLGETRNIELSFPEDYPAAELAGQPVVFEVTLNSFKSKTLPPVDEEFVKDVSEFNTVEEYRADIKQMLTTEKAAEIQNRYRAEAAQKVTEQTDVVAPESQVKAESENFMNDIRYQFSQQGIGLEQYLQLTNGKIEDVQAECDARAEGFVKQNLVFEAIAEKEGIEVSDEELDAEFDKLAEMYKQPVENVRNMFNAQGQTMMVKRNLLLDKVADFLIANAKIGPVAE